MMVSINPRESIRFPSFQSPVVNSGKLFCGNSDTASEACFVLGEFFPLFFEEIVIDGGAHLFSIKFLRSARKCTKHDKIYAVYIFLLICNVVGRNFDDTDIIAVISLGIHKRTVNKK